MRAAATWRCRDILTARITALTFEKVNGIIAPAVRGTWMTILSHTELPSFAPSSDGLRLEAVNAYL
jgi:hypothetical protein